MFQIDQRMGDAVLHGLFPPRKVLGFLLAASLAALPWLLVWPALLWHRSPELFHTWLWTNNIGRFFMVFGLPLLLCFLLVDVPRRFALGLGAVFLGGAFYTGGFGKTLHTERNFFGVTRAPEWGGEDYSKMPRVASSRNAPKKKTAKSKVPA